MCLETRLAIQRRLSRLISTALDLVQLAARNWCSRQWSPVEPVLELEKSRKVNKRFELQKLRKAGASEDSRPDCSGNDYFSDFTKVATALASSAERLARAFLCGAFLASSPLVSRSVI